MAGLQGSGKTTTTAKLARILKHKHKKTVMVVSADTYRPAAIEQLRVLAEQLGVIFCESSAEEKPTAIVTRALAEANKQNVDVLLVDSAGRLHIDDAMMAEIAAIHEIIKPIETLFVVDSMTGQDAARSAKAFNQVLPLTGVILTKTDGDARGGAALSIRYLTGKPIKWIGVGEKIEALEPFYPERMASRILGMGDVLSLIEEIEQKIDKSKAEALAKKMQKGANFDLEDYKEQLNQMLNMGGMGALVGMLGTIPGMGGMAKMVNPDLQHTQDKAFKQSIAIINSMTHEERHFPAKINGSRKQRIAKGAGLSIQHVSKVLKEHEKMKEMSKKMPSKSALMGMMSGLKGKMPGGGGGFPPGILPPGF
jgi:signal recognition particle subunit SRP54